MIDTPQLTRSDAQQVARIHLAIPREQIRDAMGPGICEVMNVVAAQEIGPAGPWFAHHLKMDPDTFDFEICVPVTAPVTATGRVQPGEIRAVEKLARAVYQGPYEGLGPAWSEFDDWIKAHGHVAAPDLWECYVAGPESGDDPSQWRTELNRPLL